MNRSIISLLLVLLVGVVAVGFYRGWFTLSSHRPDAGSDNVNINLKVDRDKMQEDAELLKNKATELRTHNKTSCSTPGLHGPHISRERLTISTVLLFQSPVS
jgi:hypothetical protein